MIEDHIKSQVAAHYSKADAGVLLLSQLGAQLTKDGHWPPLNDGRTLTEVVDETDNLSLVRDENAKAFIAIVPAGSEHIAEAAIESRHKRIFLRDVSRALLAAFTIQVEPGKHVYVYLEPKLRFTVSKENDQDGILIDTDLRTPEIDASDIRNLELEDIARLDANIREWCERHGVEHAAITWRHERQDTPTIVEDPRTSNGLERLYAAQEPSIAKRLVIPFDIAIELSRMK